MAWIAPPTRVTGDIVTAGDWNQQTGANPQHLRARSVYEFSALAMEAPANVRSAASAAPAAGFLYAADVDAPEGVRRFQASVKNDVWIRARAQDYLTGDARLRLSLIWSTVATSGDVILAAHAMVAPPSGSDGFYRHALTALGAQQTITVPSAARNEVETEISLDLTGVVASSRVAVRIRRVGDDAADTCADPIDAKWVTLELSDR